MVTEPMRILVTGGAGFIGSNFIRLVLTERSNYSVVNLDALTYAGNLESLADCSGNSRYKFIQGDIRDPLVVEQALQDCDAVVNFAAESHVDRSIYDSGPFVSTNITGTQVLMDACRKMPSCPKFLQIGTDEVYGDLPLDRPDLLFKESTPLCPSSPYSASKAAADLLVLSYHHTFGFPGIITRCSNNFGPFQFPEKVIPLFITNLIDGQRVPLYGDGLNVRDWIHVHDHCEAVLLTLERGTLGHVYNIGGCNEWSNRSLTDMLLDCMGQDQSMIEPVSDRLGHDHRYAIDASKIEQELGWKPQRSTWPAGLIQTAEWYREHEAWWRPLKIAK